MKWKVKDNEIFVQYEDRYFKSKPSEFLDDEVVKNIFPAEIDKISRHGYFTIVAEQKDSPYGKVTIQRWFDRIKKKDFVKAILQKETV